jgi:hypothetical protein
MSSLLATKFPLQLMLSAKSMAILMPQISIALAKKIIWASRFAHSLRSFARVGLSAPSPSRHFSRTSGALTHAVSVVPLLSLSQKKRLQELILAGVFHAY